MKLRQWLVVFRSLLGLTLGAVGASAAPTTAGLEVIKVLPSQTDPAIKEFDLPHFIYVDHDALGTAHPGRLTGRRELLLWIPGTQPPGGKGEGPGGAGKFCELAARLGYHVILLKYPNTQSASVCRRDQDPGAFEKFRDTIIAGGNSRHIKVSRADSIENRLIKLLLHLQRTRPAEGWGQFLAPGDTVRWEALAVAGQSQGGGHAALIGLKHRVARVICTGAPKDYNLALGRPAAWLGQKSATPKSRFFAFNHQQDHQGCSPAQQLENLQALGLDTLGAPGSVDRESPPYRHSRILTTNYPGTKLDSGPAHTSVMNPRNEGVFGKVWTYLLTEKTP